MGLSIGLIGGTGPEGKGLAVRFAQAGHHVIIGSRSAERGQEAANELAQAGTMGGADNASAAREADIVVLTVPYSGLADTLTALAEDIGRKVVVSAVVPLQFSRARVSMLELEDGSAAQEAQRLLPNARVVGAYHNLSAGHLLDTAHALDADVMVCSDDKEALQQIIDLTNEIGGLRGINGGALANSHYVEAITALQININRNYKTETGIKITGID